MQKTCHKIVLTQKQMILTSKRRAEHPLAGQNTQQQQLVKDIGIYCTNLKLLFSQKIKEQKREMNKQEEET